MERLPPFDAAARLKSSTPRGAPPTDGRTPTAPADVCARAIRSPRCVVPEVCDNLLNDNTANHLSDCEDGSSATDPICTAAFVDECTGLGDADQTACVEDGFCEQATEGCLCVDCAAVPNCAALRSP